MTAKKKTKAKPKAKKAKKKTAKKPKLLSGGNPQIPKGYGDVPVKAYIKAIPGWKKAVAARADALITAAVPKVYKAVKWNSAFYGFEGAGTARLRLSPTVTSHGAGANAGAEPPAWFLVFHVYTRYLKVGFFRGSSLKPVPPGESKHPDMRYYNIHENELDEAQFTTWVKQASKLPLERM